jgi:hypothetical protein
MTKQIGQQQNAFIDISYQDVQSLTDFFTKYKQEKLGTSDKASKINLFFLISVEQYGQMQTNTELQNNPKLYANNDKANKIVCIVLNQQLEQLRKYKQSRKKLNSYSDPKIQTSMQTFFAYRPQSNIDLRICVEQNLADYIIGVDEYTKPDSLHKLQTITQVEAKLLAQSQTTVLINVDFLDENQAMQSVEFKLTSKYSHKLSSRLRRIALITTLSKKYEFPIDILSTKKLPTTAYVELCALLDNMPNHE